jgi:hypothetical protein
LGLGYGCPIQTWEFESNGAPTLISLIAVCKGESCESREWKPINLQIWEVEEEEEEREVDVRRRSVVELWS